MIGHYLGYVSAILFIYCLLYKKINKVFGNIKLSNLLRYHYILGSIGLILVIIHALLNISNLAITFGTISLFMFTCVFISGVVIIKSKSKRRKIAVYTHIVLSIIACIFMIYHIAENLILNS